MKKVPNRKGILNRRELLRIAGTLGSLAAISPLLEACSKAGLDLPSPTITPAIQVETTPTGTEDPGLNSLPSPAQPVENSPVPSAPPPMTSAANKAAVAFVKTDNRQEGVRTAIDLLEFNPVEGKNIFLKPNFNSSDPTPGSTHPDILGTLVRKMREMGAGKITVGDRSGMGSTRQVMSDLGIFDMAETLGFETLILDNLTKSDWVMFQPDGNHWKTGFPFARPCLEAEALVQTCCLKTHRFGGQFTLSLKNSVGMVANSIPGENYEYMNELHTSRNQRLMIAEINAAYSPALIVLDGVESFISGGPDQGEKVISKVILAGTDRVAIDAIGVALLRYHGCTTQVARGKIYEQEQIARAVELGLGVNAPENIQFLTPDQDSQAYAEEIKALLLN